MKLLSFGIGLAIAAAGLGGRAPAAQAQAQTQKIQPPKPNIVVVQEGDTLDGIATAHQTTYVKLYDANNNINDPNLIYPTEQVRIPNPNEQLPTRPLPADAAPATVSPSPAASAPAVAATPPVVQSAPISGCGDNFYANFIYSHESGCRTTAMSYNGCYGIGQACPASKIAYCGADYACQNAYFTVYAGKYGGWAGAYAFWVSHGWW